MDYDAVLLVSFGGPERAEDVLPFLENVLRGRRVPRERMLEVAEHYYHFGGRSPINDQCRELIAALQPQISLPIYWGNRNWHPMLGDTVGQMAADGIRRALAIATSAYSSYSGCRQYIENIEAARADIGNSAPVIDKLPPWGSHPGFLRANADRVGSAFALIPEPRRAAARLIFTAHSIPLSLAATCAYEEQLRETAGRVAQLVTTPLRSWLGAEPRASASGFPAVEHAVHERWDLVWQSRSGPPTQPWLAPDILDHLRALAADGVQDVVCSPIGFLSDHMEVIYDLDEQAAARSRELGLNFVRAQTAGTHPAVVAMLKELIEERQAAPDLPLCAAGCCPPPQRP